MRLRRPPSARSRRRLLAAAVVLFVAASVYAIANLPPAPSERNWALLAFLVLVLVPVTISINAQEFRLTARSVGREVDLRSAFRVSVMSSAANLLPVPGAVVVRSKALFDDGTTLARSLASPAIVGMAWIATTALPAAVMLWMVASPLLGIACGAAGIAGLAISWASLVRLDPERPALLMAQIIMVEALSTLVTVIRYLVVIAAFGFDPDIGEALGLAVAGVLATAAGFFPGGLGLREVLGAAIAPLVGLDPAVAVLATGVDRVAGLIVLGVMAAVAAVQSRPDEIPANPPGETQP